MSLQQQRITELCDSLKLSGIGSHWSALAQDAATREDTFAPDGQSKFPHLWPPQIPQARPVGL